MICYQVRDKVAKTCGQILNADSFEQAILAVGRLISENPFLKDRAASLCVESVGSWDGQTGFYPYDVVCRDVKTGSECLDSWLAAVDVANQADERGEPYFSDKLVADDES